MNDSLHDRVRSNGESFHTACWKTEDVLDPPLRAAHLACDVAGGDARMEELCHGGGIHSRRWHGHGRGEQKRAAQDEHRGTSEPSVSRHPPENGGPIRLGTLAA